jgi:hypothetical protein
MKIFNNLRRDNPYHPDHTMSMNHRDIYEALGLSPTKHLPTEGLQSRKIGNVLVWVTPRIPGMNQDAKRVWCICPHCDKMLTAGKFNQHMKIHKETN